MSAALTLLGTLAQLLCQTASHYDLSLATLMSAVSCALRDMFKLADLTKNGSNLCPPSWMKSACSSWLSQNQIIMLA